MTNVDLRQQEELLERLNCAQSTKEIHDVLETLQLEKSLSELPDDVIARIELEALRLFRQLAYQQAHPFFQFLAASRPHFAMYWNTLGACSMQIELYEEALRAYGIATTICPEDPRPYFFSAYAYNKLKNSHDARLCLLQVLDLCKGKNEWQKIEEQAAQFLHYINERNDS